MIERNLQSLCFSEDFGKQMRFIAGPRQCGKTTMAKEFLETNGMLQFYFRLDDRETKQKYLKNSRFYQESLLDVPPPKTPWICFDEIHKYPKWKSEKVIIVRLGFC